MTDDVCGSTNTYTSEPCQNPAGSCPVDAHDEVSPDGGRPSKFTEDRVETILDAAKQGTTVEGCARAAGIGVSTLYDWQNEDKILHWEDDKPEFSEAFNRARAEGEQRLLRSEDVPPTFILERSYDYTKKTEHEHTGEGGGPIDITITHEYVDDE